MNPLPAQAGWLDQAQDAVCVQDLEGRVLYWNPSAERLYGWSAAEMTHRPVAQQLSPTDSASSQAALAAVLAADAWTGDLRHQTKTGAMLIVESRWSLLRDAAGRPHSVLVIDTDVTERRSLEAQTLRAKRLESIGTTAGSLAHDLNNALSPIIMGIELLEMRVQDEASRKMLKTMASSARRGVDMVKNVLTFARGQEGENRLLQPAQLVQAIEQAARASLPNTLQIQTLVEEGLWPIEGDAEQLQQTFLNLCVNASEAMPGGGQLRVQARNLTLDASAARRLLGARAGNYVVFSVTDTGTGIAPEILERIFEPFFTTRGKGKGTGLGLSMAASFVKRHGGLVEVNTVVGAGTTFNVYLPAAEHAVAPALSKRIMDRNQVILLVDDEPGIAEIAACVLERDGFRVLTASSGQEAVALRTAQAEPIGLAIVDMKMPGMDGVSTVRALRQLQPDLRCVMATGNCSIEVVDAAFGGQPVGFLGKPFTVDELRRTVEEALAEPTVIPQAPPLPRRNAELVAA